MTEILKSSFSDSYDGMLMTLKDSNQTWTYNRETREGLIESIPNKVLQLQNGSSRWNDYLFKRDERSLNMNMLILGLYPHLIFIPIKWKKVIDPITKVIDYEYNLTDCDDYFKVTEVLDTVKNYWSKKSRKEIEKTLVDDLHIFEDKKDCIYNFQFHNGANSVGNHLYFPYRLAMSDIEFSDEFNTYFIESGKTFKEKDINSPIFVTDLSFRYAIVNPRLCGFNVNMGRDKKNRWSDIVSLSIPSTILDKVIMTIPDKIADFYTSAKEDCISEPSNNVKIEAHGFDKKYSFRPNMKNRPK